MLLTADLSKLPCASAQKTLSSETRCALMWMKGFAHGFTLLFRTLSIRKLPCACALRVMASVSTCRPDSLKMPLPPGQSPQRRLLLRSMLTSVVLMPSRSRNACSAFSEYSLAPLIDMRCKIRNGVRMRTMMKMRMKSKDFPSFHKYL